MTVLNINEWLKVETLKRVRNSKMLGIAYFGITICKISVYDIKKGDVGLLTTYRPDQDSFSIRTMGESHNFNFREQWFLKHFEIIWE